MQLFSLFSGFTPSSPLRLPRFRLFYFASIGVALGYTMQATVSAWLMATMTPSPLMVALVQTASTAPTLVFGLLAGFAGRHRRAPAHHPGHADPAVRRDHAAGRRDAGRPDDAAGTAAADLRDRRRIHHLPARAAGEHQRPRRPRRPARRGCAGCGGVQRGARGGSRRSPAASPPGSAPAARCSPAASSLSG